MPDTKQFKALLGAFVMLDRIAKGESFSTLEYHSNLATYREAILEAWPGVRGDPWFAKFINAERRGPEDRRQGWKSVHGRDSRIQDRRAKP